MTATASKSTQARTRRPFKPVRFWSCVGVAGLVIMLTAVAAFTETRDTGDSSYLSPRASGGDGASQLFEALSDQGVNVERVTDAHKAFEAAAGSGATLFVPAPEYLNPAEQDALTGLSREFDVRVVSVRPSTAVTQGAGLVEDTARITTATEEPGACTLEAATQAGAAMMRRQTYAAQPYTDWEFCYGNGLAYQDRGEGEDVVVGAADPFTDEYFSTAGNADLATGLLSERDTVVWLDKHTLVEEPPPTPSFDTSSPPEPSRSPLEDPQLGSGNPLYQVLPPGIWATLVGLLIVLLGLALWKGRRLGPAVTEPLPVTVPAAETVKGRAHLYRRGKAFPETAQALRIGALERIRAATRLSSQATRTEIVTAVAERTGWTPESIDPILYGPAPEDTTQLINTTQALDALVAAVENAQGRTE